MGEDLSLRQRPCAEDVVAVAVGERQSVRLEAVLANEGGHGGSFVFVVAPVNCQRRPLADHNAVLAIDEAAVNAEDAWGEFVDIL